MRQIGDVESRLGQFEDTVTQAAGRVATLQEQLHGRMGLTEANVDQVGTAVRGVQDEVASSRREVQRTQEGLQQVQQRTEQVEAATQAAMTTLSAEIAALKEATQVKDQRILLLETAMQQTQKDYTHDVAQLQQTVQTTVQARDEKIAELQRRLQDTAQVNHQGMHALHADLEDERSTSLLLRQQLVGLQQQLQDLTSLQPDVTAPALALHTASIAPSIHLHPLGTFDYHSSLPMSTPLRLGSPIAPANLAPIASASQQENIAGPSTMGSFGDAVPRARMQIPPPPVGSGEWRFPFTNPVPPVTVAHPAGNPRIFNVELKPKEPAVFRGDGRQDVHTWARGVQTHLDLVGGDTQHQVAYVATLLADAAQTWYQRLVREHGRPGTTQQLFASMKIRFGQSTRAEEAMATLLNIKQKDGETVHQYALRFEAEVDRLTTYDAQWLLKIFIWGLKTDLATKVALDAPPLVEIAIQRAIQVETVMKMARRPTDGNQGSVQASGSNRGANQQWNSRRWFQQQQQQQRPQQSTSTGGPTTSGSAGQQTSQNKTTRHCNICGRQGHIARFCWFASGRGRGRGAGQPGGAPGGGQSGPPFAGRGPGGPGGRFSFGGRGGRGGGAPGNTAAGAGRGQPGRAAVAIAEGPQTGNDGMLQTTFLAPPATQGMGN